MFLSIHRSQMDFVKMQKVFVDEKELEKEFHHKTMIELEIGNDKQKTPRIQFVVKIPLRAIPSYSEFVNQTKFEIEKTKSLLSPIPRVCLSEGFRIKNNQSINKNWFIHFLIFIIFFFLILFFLFLFFIFIFFLFFILFFYFFFFF